MLLESKPTNGKSDGATRTVFLCPSKILHRKKGRTRYADHRRATQVQPRRAHAMEILQGDLAAEAFVPLVAGIQWCDFGQDDP